MDPWNTESSSTIAASDNKLANQVFDNSFLTDGRLDKPVCLTTNSRRLPDSHLYVSKLEERLRRVQQCGSGTGSERSGSIAAELSEQLRLAKEDALIRLVRSNSAQLDEEDLQLDAELSISYLYRRLAPHKTALTKGEKVLLLAADKLAIKLAESDITGVISDDRKNTSEEALEENR